MSCLYQSVYRTLQGTLPRNLMRLTPRYAGAYWSSVVIWVGAWVRLTVPVQIFLIERAHAQSRNLVIIPSTAVDWISVTMVKVQRTMIFTQKQWFFFEQADLSPSSIKTKLLSGLIFCVCGVDPYVHFEILLWNTNVQLDLAWWVEIFPVIFLPRFL